MSPRNGRFIVLDGPDGCGKTTQVELLHEELAKQGHEVMVTREPGGTPIGEKIRAILLDPANREMTARTELFLYMACRSQLVEEVIAPAIANGVIVLCDRFLSSTVAYQGYGGELGPESVRDIGDFCIGPVRPHLSVFLDVDFATSVARRGDRPADRIEQREPDYHERVRNGFLEQARTDPTHCKVVDARRSTNEVHQEILELLPNVL